jgi:hypothetical protein
MILEERRMPTGQIKLYRQAVREAFTVDEVREILLSLHEIATSGKPSDRISASKLLLEYVVGKPEQVARDDSDSKVSVSAHIFRNHRPKVV